MNAPPRPHRHAAGFSLVEIMVAMLVSLFLLAGVLQLYLGNQQTSRLGNSVGEVQQAGQFALDELVNNVRMAAFQGCARMDLNNLFPPPKILALNTPTTNLADTAVRGFEVAANGTWTGGAAPANWNGAVPRPLSDVLQVQGGSRAVVNLASTMSSESAAVALASNPDNIVAGEMVLIADCSAVNVFRVTSVTGGLTLVHTTSDNSSASLAKPYAHTGLNAAQATRFNSWVYFVRDSGRDAADGSAIFSLYRLDTSRLNQTAQELVEGVEYLQVLYGQRVPNSGNINYFTAPSVTDWSQVVAVKLALLVASRDPVLDVNDATAGYALLDQTVAKTGTSGAAITYPNDRRLRRVFAATVNVRNRRDLPDNP
ncbi:MAG TPA: PilW family protein [Candidatus Acidoferrales bacterium]|nr:PilW family protein [Candidatus Acidoferrales bacterium]